MIYVFSRFLTYFGKQATSSKYLSDGHKKVREHSLMYTEVFAVTCSSISSFSQIGKFSVSRINSKRLFYNMLIICLGGFLAAYVIANFVG